MRCLVTLLMTSLLGLSACTFMFQADAEDAEDAGATDNADAGQLAACQGLSRIVADQNTSFNSSTWWSAASDGASLTQTSSSIVLTTDATTDGRNVTMGSQDFFEMSDTLSIHIEDLVLHNEPLSTFYLALNSGSGQSKVHELGLSISYGTLSLFKVDGQGGFSGAAPAAPFWLIIEVEEGVATLSILQGETRMFLGTLSVGSEAVKLTMGLTAESGGPALQSRLQIGQIGNAPGFACE